MTHWSTQYATDRRLTAGCAVDTNLDHITAGVSRAKQSAGGGEKNKVSEGSWVKKLGRFGLTSTGSLSAALRVESSG